MKLTGFSQKHQGQKLTTIPGLEGVLTGTFFNDYNGTWFEVEQASGTFYMQHQALPEPIQPGQIPTKFRRL